MCQHHSELGTKRTASMRFGSSSQNLGSGTGLIDAPTPHKATALTEATISSLGVRVDESKVVTTGQRFEHSGEKKKGSNARRRVEKLARRGIVEGPLEARAVVSEPTVGPVSLKAPAPILDPNQAVRDILGGAAISMQGLQGGKNRDLREFFIIETVKRLHEELFGAAPRPKLLSKASPRDKLINQINVALREKFGAEFDNLDKPSFIR